MRAAEGCPDRRISLLHHEGVSWSEIGARVGQRNLSTTADIYSYVLMDYRETNRTKLLKRVRTPHTPDAPLGGRNSLTCGDV